MPAVASKLKFKSKSLYSVHPGVAMIQKWIAELAQKTGRSLEQWIALARESGPATEKDCREWLKREYQLGTNSAWWIAERAVGKDQGDGDGDPEAYLRAADAYVEAMFSGKKAALRPLYDQLLKSGLRLGKDVKACPCKTIVPLYRNHVFAQIKPTTNTRIDLGFALGDRKAPKRLIATGGYAKGDRITHRIEITKISDIDNEVKRWMEIAYRLDA
ncbi:MAG: DUF5655 domain-containing protein [Acidobacteriia bacterium]|nr:DUF5655 domain-containing protein [Terriglobia bacterium]